MNIQYLTVTVRTTRYLYQWQIVTFTCLSEKGGECAQLDFLVCIPRFDNTIEVFHFVQTTSLLLTFYFRLSQQLKRRWMVLLRRRGAMVAAPTKISSRRPPAPPKPWARSFPNSMANSPAWRSEFLLPVSSLNRFRNFHNNFYSWLCAAQLVQIHQDWISFFFVVHNIFHFAVHDIFNFPSYSQTCP